MCATEHSHTPTPEDIMAYLDGESIPMPRDAMDAHIAGCATCQAVVTQLRAVSAETQAWRVGDAPDSLRAPARPGRLLAWPTLRWTRSRAAMAALGTAAAVMIVIAAQTSSIYRRASAGPPVAFTQPLDKLDHHQVPAQVGESSALRGQSSAGSAMDGGAAGSPAVTVPEPVQPAEASAVPRAPMVIRTATLAVVAKQFEGVRAAVEAIVSQSNGFIDHLSITGDTASARSLGATLRVPGDRMAAALEKLRQLGQVVEDTQGSEDVTDQLVDLDARLANARAIEQRMADILRNRTGKLSDVLEVEREIARVRLDIERMDAEKANMNRRVSYATITLTVSEERKASIEAGPLSLGTRLRIAAADGIETGFETVFGAVLFVLRSGPVLLLCAAAGAAAWLILRRVFSRLQGSQSTASE